MACQGFGPLRDGEHVLLGVLDLAKGGVKAQDRSLETEAARISGRTCWCPRTLTHRYSFYIAKSGRRSHFPFKTVIWGQLVEILLDSPVGKHIESCGKHLL